MTPTSIEPWEEAYHNTPPSPAQQQQHHRVLTRLLFDPALEQREREVATAQAVTLIAHQARRDRLLLAEALKEQHKLQLAEEVATMNKRVEETQVRFLARPEPNHPPLSSPSLHSFPCFYI